MTEQFSNSSLPPPDIVDIPPPPLSVEEPTEVDEERRLNRMSYSFMRGPRPIRSLYDDISPDDIPTGCAWTSFILLALFWTVVSMMLMMGIYGSENLEVGSYSSIMLQPNPLFVHKLEVENLKELKMAPMLYDFYRAPPLDITKTWSETRYASVKPESHKEWMYVLNAGSQINISYNVTISSSLLLIIAKGVDEMSDWMGDPSYPHGTLSWNVIHGNGTIVQSVTESSHYYVVVANVNTVDAKVKLKLSVQSVMYDTTNSYFMCNMTRGSCNLKIPFPGSNVVVLTLLGPQEDEDVVYVKVSYEPRWTTYYFGIGGTTLIVLLGTIAWKLFRDENNNVGTDRFPLLSPKDDDLSSLGSYDSQNEDEPEENLEDEFGKGGKNHKVRRCVICFAAPKDCFFIPCGHSASCFACGARIAKDAGICPICRRKIQRVRKIYNV